MHRSKRKMTYHGREGHPYIHETKQGNRQFIMVRTKGGGTKRLYLTARAKRLLYSKGGYPR